MSDSKLLPAIASRNVDWLNPAVSPPPRGVKLMLFTSGGVAVMGDWMEDSNLVAWSPFPARPAGLTLIDAGGYGWTQA